MINSLRELNMQGRTMSMAGETCPRCNREMISSGRFLFCTEACGFGWKPVVTWAKWEDEMKPNIKVNK
jgi:tRNA(Ile2) C34 agmatinyltransferase TiaS